MATLVKENFDAVVFDLDGVITETQELHARAWKTVFDEFLRARAGSDDFEPFVIERDYYQYVDGLPRYDGVECFLESRDISLPRGKPGDRPGNDSVCALGNRKNEIFLRLLDDRGVKTIPGSVDFVRKLRHAGFKTAVVSSSRNCVPVLAAAGVLELFDAKVDGKDLDEQDLAGKPAPDMFCTAARQLGVSPDCSVAIEDAQSGVAAARAAGFGAVIGVGDDSRAQALRDHGAGLVVKDLAEIRIAANADDGSYSLAVDGKAWTRFRNKLGDRKPVLFLDFDGTLTPIVSDPADASLSPDMQQTLACVARYYVTAIVSGRDLADVRDRVGLDGIVYAGSHGFDIVLPDGRRSSPGAAHDALPELDWARRQLEEALSGIDGLIIERKKFAIAVHYRNVAREQVDSIGETVRELAEECDHLRKRGGKQIFELLPDIEWDKGEAVSWLIEQLGIDTESGLPVYFGDDVTDEDAFAVLKDVGIGVAVNAERQSTNADIVVPDVAAVQSLLNELCHDAETGRPDDPARQ